MSKKEAFFPGQPQIDAYGNNGFRFAEMSHVGSVLFLPDGVYSWPITNFEQITLASFAKVFENAHKIEFLLFGTGEKQVFPNITIRRAFEQHNIGFDFMDTGAACRTYNICMEERRAVAAALIAVDVQSAKDS